MTDEPTIIPFHCKKHGWKADTFPAASVICGECGNLCYPPEEYQGIRTRALTSARVRKHRTAA